jgi:hypothetical protein
MWVKMWDPPTASPATPELLNPTNPVPELMAAAGFQNTPTIPHTVQRDLLHNTVIPMWDGKPVMFFTFRDTDNPATINGNYPAATIRMPRGVVYHGRTQGHGPPPHTIHWHGIEPTPINDGVGHCSMELGAYTYQWQPNFTGTYFCHCHRNTVQHFEFGLFGLLIIDPPDAYFATENDPSIPIGAGEDGARRVACNLPRIAPFSQFPEFEGGDPVIGVANGDPHAFTVAYDVEAFWVLDDVDSVWRDVAMDAKSFYPKAGNIPGVNDTFYHGFFHDFNPDYWFVTGVPVPAPKGGTAPIAANVVIPPALNSGVSGTQVSINARIGDTILIRCLCAAYNCVSITFPVDVVIIAFDGRALGVPPFGLYNAAFVVKKGIPFHLSTARRFDALIRSTKPINSFAKVEFINTRGQVPGFPEDVVMTAQIPIVIS